MAGLGNIYIISFYMDIMNHTKKEWKTLVLEYLSENSQENVSIRDIGNMYGNVPKNLKDAVEELERENKINIIKDNKGKKWLKSI
jgi:DNA-binding HxlR family transcriptional regulator